MSKYFIIALVAAAFWLGAGIDFVTDGGFQLSVPAAEAKNGGNGNGGGNGGGKGGGNGKADGGNKGQGKSAGKREERASKVAYKVGKPNVRSELKGLNSLNRNINGLINSNSPHIAAFRDLFYEGDTLRKPAEIEDLADLLGLEAGTDPDIVTNTLRDVLGNLSDDAVAEVESMLNQRLTEFKSLPVDENGNVIRGGDDDGGAEG